MTKLRAWRQSEGLSQPAAAGRLKISSQRYPYIERGDLPGGAYVRGRLREYFGPQGDSMLDRLDDGPYIVEAAS